MKHSTTRSAWKHCQRKRRWSPFANWTRKDSSIQCGRSRRPSSAGCAIATRIAWRTALRTREKITLSCSAPNGWRRSRPMPATAADCVCASVSMGRSAIHPITRRWRSTQRRVMAAGCAGQAATRMRSRCLQERLSLRRREYISNGKLNLG